MDRDKNLNYLDWGMNGENKFRLKKLRTYFCFVRKHFKFPENAQYMFELEK